MTLPNLPPILQQIPLDSVDRITASLEGDWSPNEVEIWLRGPGFLGFAGARLRHAVHRPSLEFYLGDVWIGVPCFVRREGVNFLDEELAEEIVRRVESA